jgi:hypothetical protein
MTNDRPGRAKQLLRHLHILDAPIDLPSDADVDELVPRRARGAMLFDFYTPDAVREALERYGITAKLAERGWTAPVVELETAEADRQVVRVLADRARGGVLLGEAILRVGPFETAAPFAEELHGERFSMLFIQWLRLQDPSRRFSRERPALPGQDHPGLGAGREVVKMFLGMAERLALAGIVSCPEFAHNAVLYEAVFRFFDPAAQGRFEALMAASTQWTLAELTWGVESGCVLDEATGESVAWSREEMICPTSRLLREYLASADYRGRADEARRTCRFRFDRERYTTLAPLRPDGSPR